MKRWRWFWVLMLLWSPIVTAGIMADLNDMFMSNSTASGTIQTRDRTGVFGGSVRMRSPVQGATIITFDPPRLDAGCAGVDLYGGSFTFINASAMVDLFRKVASQAVGLAFKAAIDAISPGLSKLMSEFQTMVQRLNELAKNSCNLAHLIWDPAEKQLASAVGGDAFTNNAINRQMSDWAAGLEAYLADPNALINQVAHLNPKSGNGVVKAILKSGSTSILGIVGLANGDGSTDDPNDPNSLNVRVLVSLLGFKIDAIDCQVQNTDGNSSSATQVTQQGENTLTQKNCVGENTLTLDRIIKGGGPNSADPDGQLFMWECIDAAGSSAGAGNLNTDDQKCTAMRKSLYPYVGIKGFVNTMLFGVGSLAGRDPDENSIVGKFNRGQTAQLTEGQIRFIQQSGVPLIRFLAKTTDPNTRVGIASQLEPHITSCIAAKVGDALYRAANDVTGIGGYTFPEQMQSRISDLRGDFMRQQELCDKRESVMNVMSQLVMATNLSNDNIK